MVKKGKSAAKNAKTEETASEVPEAPTDSVEEATNVEENGDNDSKKKVKGKSSKKEDSNEENNDEEIKENGNESVEKKKPAAKKAKAASKKPAVEPERKSSRQPKPLVKEGDQNESYEVEKIIDSRVHYGKVEFLVRWKGYSRGDDTWEEESDLNDCTELLQKFKAEQTKGKKRSSTSKSPVRAKKARPAKKEENYEVEAVVGVRVKGGKKEYKIHWKGYKTSEDTWEPEKHLSCQDLIKKYLAENKDQVNEEVKAKTPTKRKAPAKKKSAKKGKAK